MSSYDGSGSTMPSGTSGRAAPTRCSGLDDPDRPALEERPDVFQGVVVERLVAGVGHVPDVGGQHRSGRLAQRMIRAERLLVVHVEAGAGDPALAERPDQRSLVDDRSP